MVDNPAILVGEDTYSLLAKEIRRQSLGHSNQTFAFQPIDKFNGMNIYIVDRSRYLNIVEEGDIIG